MNTDSALDGQDGPGPEFRATDLHPPFRVLPRVLPRVLRCLNYLDLPLLLLWLLRSEAWVLTSLPPIPAIVCVLTGPYMPSQDTTSVGTNAVY